MSRSYTVLLATLAVLALGTRGEADIVLTASLTNGQEVHTVEPRLVTGELRPVSYGEATLVLNAAQTALTYFITVYNLDFTGSQTADVNDNLTAAHIHHAAAGSNGPVVFGFFGTPFNDNNPNDVVVTPFATGVGGTIAGKWDLLEGNNTTLSAQIPNILAGNTYLNFHTTQYPGGEIRGQIVPEPSSLALLALGSVGLALTRRRAAARC